MTTTTISQPLESKTALQTRIIGYDFARALAVLGMFLVNFKLVMGASDAGASWLVGLIGLVEGRAAATFVVLAGIGLSLFSARARQSGSVEEQTHARNQLFKRAIFLFVFGLAYSPIWPADILHFYGVYIAFAALVLYVPDRQLLAWAGAFIAIFVGMFLVLNYESGWDWNTLDYVDFWTPIGLVRHMFFNGWHPAFPWAAFVLLGMWIGRQDIRNAQVQQRLLIISLITLIIVEASSIILISTLTPSFGFELASAFFGRSMIPPMPFYILSGSATAVITIVLSVMFTERFQHQVWIQPFTSTGQLALSLYVAHVLIGMGILEVLGWLDSQSLIVAVIYSLAFYIGSVVFSHLWRQRYKRGPVEWVMRQLTG